MFIDILRKTEERFVKKYFLWIYNIGLTPNRITFISFLFLVISVYFFVKGKLYAGGIFITLSYFFDMLDGGIARLTNNATKVGYFLDKIVDCLRSSVWIALAYGGFISFKLAVFAIFFILCGHSIARVIELNKLRNSNIPVIPDMIFIILATLTGKIYLFCLFMIVSAIIFIFLNILIISILNRK